MMVTGCRLLCRRTLLPYARAASQIPLPRLGAGGAAVRGAAAACSARAHAVGAADAADRRRLLAEQDGVFRRQGRLVRRRLGVVRVDEIDLHAEVRLRVRLPTELLLERVLRVLEEARRGKGQLQELGLMRLLTTTLVSVTTLWMQL